MVRVDTIIEENRRATMSRLRSYRRVSLLSSGTLEKLCALSEILLPIESNQGYEKSTYYSQREGEFEEEIFWARSPQRNKQQPVSTSRLHGVEHFSKYTSTDRRGMGKAMLAINSFR